MMNKEVIEAMSRKEKKHTFRIWWNKNGYKVLRVILFPLWIIETLKNKLQKWLNSREKWSEDKVKKILNYYIPRKAEWDNENRQFYFFDNGYGWSIHLAKRYLKRKDRRFWKLHSGLWGRTIRDYLIHNFELEGFTKKIGDCSEGWTEVTFTMIDK